MYTPKYDHDSICTAQEGTPLVARWGLLEDMNPYTLKFQQPQTEAGARTAPRTLVKPRHGFYVYSKNIIGMYLQGS